MITTIISAATAIFVVLLKELLIGSKTLKKLDKHDERDYKEHQTLLTDHNNQDSVHNKLLDVNNEIKLDCKLLLNSSEKIGGKIDFIDRTLTEEKAKKRQQYESLSDKQKEMKISLDKLAGFADELEKVSLQNARLHRENESLIQENEELRVIIRRQKDEIINLEHDYER